jgi:hypothetical protein
MQIDMKLNDSDIITAARDLRNAQNERLHVAPNPMKRNSKPTPLWWAATAAALIIGYVAGGGLTPNPSPIGEGSGHLQELAEAQSSEITTSSLTGREGESEPAIIREVIHEVVHDTIYETRIVRVPVQQVMTAQAKPEPETPGCSMLCDDIPYDLLAGN